MLINIFVLSQVTYIHRVMFDLIVIIIFLTIATYGFRPWSREQTLSPLGIFVDHVFQLGYSVQESLQLVLQLVAGAFLSQGSKKILYILKIAKKYENAQNMQIIRQPAVTPIAIIFAYYNLTKKHGLQKSLGGEGFAPWLMDQYTHSGPY